MKLRSLQLVRISIHEYIVCSYWAVDIARDDLYSNSDHYPGHRGRTELAGFISVGASIIRVSQIANLGKVHSLECVDLRGPRDR